MDKDTAFKIVVIDDSDLIRRHVVNLLEKEGYNVVGEASSAQEAAALIKNSKAHLYILDVVMPEKSGIELAKDITENVTLGTKIIMTSSLSEDYIIIESISNGAVDFLLKPFEDLELLRSVATIYKNFKG